MPVRVMGYDYYTYNKQYQDRRAYYKQNNIKLVEHEFISGIRKTDRFLPVVTLVLYYGEENWDGPKSLFDIMSAAKLYQTRSAEHGCAWVSSIMCEST